MRIRPPCSPTTMNRGSGAPTPNVGAPWAPDVTVVTNLSLAVSVPCVMFCARAALSAKMLIKRSAVVEAANRFIESYLLLRIYDLVDVAHEVRIHEAVNQTSDDAWGGDWVPRCKKLATCVRAGGSESAARATDQRIEALTERPALADAPGTGSLESVRGALLPLI